MTARAVFTPAHSPQNDIRDAECQVLGVELAHVFMRNAQAERDFRDFARAGPLAKYERLFEATLAACRRRKDLQGERFYTKLKIEYDMYLTSPIATAQTWNKALGAIIEYAFLELMRLKYPDNVTIMHEHLIAIPLDNGEVINCGSKPMDVIAWIESEWCGEFLEIKKDLDTREGDDNFAEKVHLMYLMLVKLASKMPHISVVGVGTLARSPFGVEVVRAALETYGHLRAGQTINDLDPRLTVLHSDNVRKWHSDRVWRGE